MKLSKKQLDKLTQYLSEKWKKPVSCAVCGENKWTISESVHELREFHGGSMVIGGSALIPLVPITCNNCGNTVLLNPLIAGIDLKEANDER